jgi:hypothetical protein
MIRGCARWFVGLVLAVGPAAVGAQLSPASTTPAPEIASDDPLLVQVDQAIQINGQRFLVANSNSPWQIFHGILAYKKELMLRVGDQKMSAIEWVATHEPRFDGRPLLLATPHGAKFHPFTREYAFEGHPAQTLALLSESHLPPDFEFKLGDRKVTIADFLNNTLMEINDREEITWVLWALINYLKCDAQWTDQWGRPWSIEKLVQMQVNAPVVGAPCGGNHGLFVLARARDKYLKSGRELRGVWYQADYKIKQYIEIARSLQNADGTFSADFYRGPGYATDMKTRFNTTGHTLEFLAVGLPDQRLNEPWVRNAVHILSKELIDYRRMPIDPGPLYHSINALMNYRDRVRALMPAAPSIAETKPAAPGTVVLKPATTARAPAPPAPLVVSPQEAAPVPLPGPQAANASKVLSLLDPIPLPAPLEEEPVSALRPANR